jgi:hypothetical protein
MLMVREIAWWYWLVTAVSLAVGLAGWFLAFYAAIALCVVQIGHFSIREASVRAFPVQVRVAYLLILVVALWRPLNFMYWILLLGTSALVLFGYCTLARIMSLMPWNRSEPLTASLVKRTFLTPPVRGSVLHGLPAE